jgi:hypothetical protein
MCSRFICCRSGSRPRSPTASPVLRRAPRHPPTPAACGQ